MPSITLSHISWSAPDGTTVLSDIDFRFTPERIGLVGRNGVGKSTLLALISGRLKPTSGSIQRDGTIAELRQTVQVAPDETIADMFGVSQAMALLSKAERGEADMAELEACDWTLPSRIEEALADTGLEALPETPLSQLSGGQRTRAALAGAVFARPDFLLLDEPTNNLDADGRAALIALFVRWRAGAIVVSHDRALLEEMEAIAELTTLGISRHGGNFSSWRARKAVELAAAEQDLANAQRHQREIARRTQIATERKQRRDAAGARKGAKGDMPRILIGMRKDRAEGSGGEAARLAERLRRESEQAAQAARQRIEVVESLTVALPSTAVLPGQRIVTLDHVTAAHDPDAPILKGLSFTVNGPGLAACEAALGDEVHLARVRRDNAAEREALADALQARELAVAPSLTNFLLVDFGRDAAPVEAGLVARGVVPRPMGGYGLPTCLRLMVGTRDENRRLLQALDEVRA